MRGYPDTAVQISGFRQDPGPFFRIFTLGVRHQSLGISDFESPLSTYCFTARGVKLI